MTIRMNFQMDLIKIFQSVLKLSVVSQRYSFLQAVAVFTFRKDKEHLKFSM